MTRYHPAPKTSEERDAIRNDPFVRGLLARLPAEQRNSFSDEQLLGLKIALGARQWKIHPVDLRGTIPLWRWRFYQAARKTPSFEGGDISAIARRGDQ